MPMLMSALITRYIRGVGRNFEGHCITPIQISFNREGISHGTSPGTSHVTSHGTSHVTSRGTSYGSHGTENSLKVCLIG